MAVHNCKNCESPYLCHPLIYAWSLCYCQADGNMRVLVWFVVRLVRQVLVRLIVSPWANSGGSRVTQDYTMDMRSDDLDTLLTTVTYEAPRHQPHLLQTNLVRTSTGISLSLYEIAASRSNRQFHPGQ